MAAFTTIAAAGGLAIAAGGSAMSFAQAGAQQRKMRQAQSAADKAMQEARKRLEPNYFEALSIQKEPYELQREALLSAGAQGIQAGAESGRQAAATAGRVQMAQNEAQAGIRTDMGKELTDLEQLTAQEESRLRDINVQIDMEEAAGAQQAAADAEAARQQAIAQGMQGIQNTAQQAVSLVPLFQKSGAETSAMKSAVGDLKFNPDEFQKFGNVGKKGGMGAPGTGGFTNLDFDKVAGMSNRQFNRFMNALTPQQQAMIYGNKQFRNSYNAFDYLNQ